MKRSMFSEEQIIGILKEQEAGMPTAEVAKYPASRSCCSNACISASSVPLVVSRLR
jgi:hypothetical protein